MTREELDKDMIESIEMWLHECEPKYVEKELAWLDELRTRLLEEKSEKPVPADLEEAAEEYKKQVIEETKCHHNALTYAEGYEDALLLIPDAFIAGAKWQKEQMMEEAVEGEVCIPNVWVEHKEGKELVVRAEISKEFGFKFGDKVRVIVCKKEDKKDR